MIPGKFAYRIRTDLLQSVDEPNFFIAPSLPMLAADPENLKENLEILKGVKYSILFIGAPEKDIMVNSGT